MKNISDKLTAAINRGNLRGLGPKSIKAGLDKLPDDDLKKITLAIEELHAEREAEENDKRAAEEKRKLTPKKIAGILQKALKDDEWDYRKYDFYCTDKGIALADSLDDWLGEGAFDRLERALCYYFGDCDTFRKMSPHEAESEFSAAEKEIKRLISELQKL